MTVRQDGDGPFDAEQTPGEPLHLPADPGWSPGRGLRVRMVSAAHKRSCSRKT